MNESGRMIERIKHSVLSVGKVALIAILFVCAVMVNFHLQKRAAQDAMEELLAKQYAGYASPQMPFTEKQGAAPKADATAEALNMLTTQAEDDTVQKLLEAEATLGVKTSSYPEYHPDVLMSDWAKDTAYGVRIDMPRVMFQDLEWNDIDVVYPGSVNAGEQGTIIVRIKNKGSGAEFIARKAFMAMDDLKLVYGSTDPEVASGDELDYGPIGDGKSLVLYFYTGATDRHHETHRGHCGRSGAFGYLSVDYYRVIE